MDNAEKIVDAAIRRLGPGAKGTIGTQPKAEAPRPLMREMPPPDPFPVEALGSVLADAAIGIQDRTRAPIAICGQSVMAAATLVTQGHADVRLPTGQLRPISNFFATVAVTGERKTAADAEATWPIRKREEVLRGQYDPARQDYENAKEAWECARKHAMKVGKGNAGAIRAALTQLGPPPNEPLLPFLAVTEPTIEGLVKVFAKGWPSLGVFSDEGGMFIGGYAMKEDARLRTATTLSKLWDGNTIDRIRSGEGAQVLPGRRLAMHLMAQPNVAALLLGDGMLAEQGLLSRILPTAPESAIGTRTWRTASDDSDRAVRAYGKRLLDILELPPPLAVGKQNELAPREVKLTVEAYEQWIGFHDHIEHDLKEDRPLWPIRGLGNKIPEIVVRLSGVLALVENATAQEIAADVLERGIALAEHYIAEALRLFEATQADAELVQAQTLLHWLTTQWEQAVVGLPDIYRLGPNSVRDMKTARRLVGILESHGHLSRIEGGAQVGENYRREAWEIAGRHARD
jgi:uncharacterized protein DUF3987